MKSVAEFVGDEEAAEEYDWNADKAWDAVDALHWNEQEQMYCDVSSDDQRKSFFNLRARATLTKALLVPDDLVHVCHKVMASS